MASVVSIYSSDEITVCQGVTAPEQLEFVPPTDEKSKASAAVDSHRFVSVLKFISKQLHHLAFVPY